MYLPVFPVIEYIPCGRLLQQVSAESGDMSSHLPDGVSLEMQTVRTSDMGEIRLDGFPGRIFPIDLFLNRAADIAGTITQETIITCFHKPGVIPFFMYFLSFNFPILSPQDSVLS